jgi:WavE lipopolysaccharide synthesis
VRVRSEDVSVVVQGPIEARTPEVIASVRRHLPAAQLIVSTWAGATARGLDIDDLLLNEDPGSVPWREPDGSPSPRNSNTNRMLRSTRLGLRRAERPFALKLRSDSPLTHDGFLSWWGRFDRRVPTLKVFESRIVTTSIATRPGRTMPGYLFHPSDCAHFGLTSDVVQLWSTAEIDEEANATFRPPPGADGVAPGPAPRHWNEQVLWLGCLAGSGNPVDYPFTGYIGPGIIELSDLSLVNNFTVLESWQFGVAFPTLDSMTQMSALASYMWYPYWISLYRSLSAAPATAA